MAQGKIRVEVRKASVAEAVSNPRFLELAREYAAEAKIAGLPDPDEKLAAYAALEHSGIFQGFAAFLGAELIGFIVVLLPVLPHYGAAVGVTESFFVAKAHRHTGAGLMLLRAAENHVRAAGAPGVLVSAPKDGVLAEVLQRRRGYRETNRVFFKAFADG